MSETRLPDVFTIEPDDGAPDIFVIHCYYSPHHATTTRLGTLSDVAALGRALTAFAEGRAGTERKPCGAWRASGDERSLSIGIDTIVVRRGLRFHGEPTWWVGSGLVGFAVSSMTDFFSPESAQLAAEDAALDMLNAAIAVLRTP